VKTIKTWWLVAAFLSGVAVAMWAEELILRAQENRLEFSAPGVRLLTGKPLERLTKTAKAVPFDFQVTIAVGRPERIVRRSVERFVISYDIWQEDYTVNRIASAPRSLTHVSARQAEAWCFQEMAVDLTGIAPGQPIWAEMDIRAVDDRDARLFADITESGINLTPLLELFARPPRTEQPHWKLEAGPYTIEQLRRGRG
jgi:hypothetical protein